MYYENCTQSTQKQVDTGDTVFVL